MNNRYRKFQNLITKEVRWMNKDELEDFAIELNICTDTLVGIIEGAQEPSLSTAFRLLEMLEICEGEGYCFLEKVKQVTKMNKKSKTTAVTNWIKRDSFERVRWNTYLNFCDLAGVDAIDFWEM
ncbi:MAG: hypothetical protein ACRCWQ_01560 [Bacilli bacterium]